MGRAREAGDSRVEKERWAGLEKQEAMRQEEYKRTGAEE